MPAVSTVILTREPEDNAALADMLRDLPVRVVEYPCIETRFIPFDPGLLPAGASLARVAALVFTSRRGVQGMASAAARFSGAGLLLAAVGPATAGEVAAVFGRPADVVATAATGEGLARDLVRLLPAGALVLAVRGDKTTGSLKATLEAAGMRVHEVVAYENRAPRLQPLQVEGRCVAVFASPSAADRFFAANPSQVSSVTAVAVGPTTADRLRHLGVQEVLTARGPEVAAVAECIRNAIGGTAR